MLLIVTTNILQFFSGQRCRMQYTFPVVLRYMDSYSTFQNHIKSVPLVSIPKNISPLWQELVLHPLDKLYQLLIFDFYLLEEGNASFEVFHVV